MRMPWLESLNLGVSRFDDDHRHMFDLLNELNASITAENLSGVRALFGELQRTTLEHFHHEEEMMARVGYPQILAHIAEHDHTRQVLLGLHGLVVSGRLDRLEQQLTEYGARYFRGILRDDTLLARYLGEREDVPHRCAG